MKQTITKTFTFEAAHRLPHVPPTHKCHRLHGHSFRVEVVLVGDVGDPGHTGWVQDFADIGEAWKPVHEALDHRYLNEVQGLGNPTSELIAVWIYDKLKPAMPLLKRVTVSETCTSSATFER